MEGSKQSLTQNHQMHNIEIHRTHLHDRTLGTGTVMDNFGIRQFQFVTLELPNLGNQRRISCIPEGVYKYIKHESPTFGSTLWVQDVPERSEILVHHGNFTKDTLGCILCGRSFYDIDGDSTTDVTNSRKTLERLLELVPDEGTIKLFS